MPLIALPQAVKDLYHSTEMADMAGILQSFSQNCTAPDVTWSSGGNWMMVGGDAVEGNYRKFLFEEGDPMAGMKQSETHWTLGPYGVQNDDLMAFWGVIELTMRLDSAGLHYRSNKSASYVMRKERGAWKQVYDCYSRPRVEAFRSAMDEPEGSIRYFPARTQGQVSITPVDVPEVVARYLDAMAKNNLDDVLACYADDTPDVASIQVSDWPVFGKACILKSLASRIDEVVKIENRDWHIGPYGVSADDTASIWGVVRDRVRMDDNGPAIVIDTRYHFVLRRVGDDWKILLAHGSRPRADDEYNNMMKEDPRVVLHDPRRALSTQETHTILPSSSNGMVPAI